MKNNLTVPEMEKKDKLWKPWLNSFREKCLQVPPDSYAVMQMLQIYNISLKTY